MKWHQAHTTWFFETFLLYPYIPGYVPFCEDFGWLFNSYYHSLGGRIPGKCLRSCISRPSLDQVLTYRTYVDHVVEDFLSSQIDEAAMRCAVLGINHEQQHQELMLTDIKHAFFSNPMYPLYAAPRQTGTASQLASKSTWRHFNGGLTQVGHQPDRQNPLLFCFDNETPRHKVYTEPFLIADRLVTCREYLDFILDKGYARPELWLSEGWDTVRRQGWQAPLYWEGSGMEESDWRVFTLRGWEPMSNLLNTPVCHVSHFEADAFARWRDCRLPTESEWELTVADAPVRGNLLESGTLHPVAAEATDIDQFFGDCWEWTASAYSPYPGYKPLSGALGEYNGKFMSNQMILRGGSCVTPAGHIRPTYRNFFHPATRWQFSGIRLASSRTD